MTEMPSAPWWSQPAAAPGATAVLPSPPHDGREHEPPPPPDQPVRQRARRGGTAWLLALALIAGGGIGGAVAVAVDDEPAAGTTPIAQTPVVGSGDPVKGTPESAAAVIGPSVVTVQVTGLREGPFGGASQVSGSGSGIIIREQGFVLTNNHVIAAADTRGGAVHLTLRDGRTVPATIVGRDPSIDLAVLRINGVDGLRPATFADSSKLNVGQAVLAVGAPLGLANTVTQGIVSTLQRPVRTGDSSSSQAVIDAVQTDAAINPGNSGGALVDLAGRVVGVNSAIATVGGGQAGNIGVGFAIPSNTAVKVADQLIATGKATHSQIGVSVGEAPSLTDGAPGLGAAIVGVTRGGPADQAGLKVGDVVTRVNDRRVTDADSLIVAIRSHDPGTRVTLTVTRGGATRTLQVTLASVSS